MGKDVRSPFPAPCSAPEEKEELYGKTVAVGQEQKGAKTDTSGFSNEVLIDRDDKGDL